MATATTTSRYDTILKLASGGMATVYVGTVRGALGFRQLVAIKKPHPHLLALAHFRSELVAEARLASMIHHANVVDVRDVEIEGESISLVMDYIEGASFGEMIVSANKDKSKKRMAPRVVVRIVLDALAGLHAAHELVDERDRFVGLVHRDISPQNILVGSDGIARVADFGVAKFSRKNMESTSDGSLKGKLAYMAPEYLKGETIDRRFDLFAMGVVLWEAIAGKRCFRGDNEAETLNRLLTHDPEPISTIVPEAAALDAVISCALAKAMEDRFANAAAMAAALEASASAAGLLGGHSEVAAAVKEVAGKAIEERRVLVRAKLANEPSVASLMGVPFDLAIPPAEPQSPTVVQAPAGAQKTDEIPATDAISTESGPHPTVSDSAKTQVPATAAPATAIPATTLPMTPRMEGAPDLPSEAAQARGNRTLASPGVLPAASAPVPTTLPLAGASGHPPPANATHLSAGVVGPSTSNGPSPTATTINDAHPVNPPPPPVASSRTAIDDDPVVVPAPRRWVLPLVVGLATAAIATAAIVAGTKHLGGSSGAGASSAAPAAASVRSTPSSTSTGSTAPSATAAATTTTTASSPAPPASVKGTPTKGGKPRAPGAGATAAPPEPTPPPGDGRKPPPPNPYAE